MKVVEVTTTDNKTRYYLTDDTGIPVEAVLMYLKFKDDAGYARNTLRMHCIHLKHYFAFLQETDRNYEQATVNTLARFIGDSCTGSLRTVSRFRAICLGCRCQDRCSELCQGKR